MELVANMDMVPGAFYDLASGFLLPLANIEFKTALTVDKSLPITCMFEISLVYNGTERVGFFFTTKFEVANGGGYLLTTMNSNRRATEVDVLIKNKDLVLYNYPNRGTLAISPKVGDEILTIFQEQ